MHLILQEQIIDCLRAAKTASQSSQIKVIQAKANFSIELYITWRPRKESFCGPKVLRNVHLRYIQLPIHTLTPFTPPDPLINMNRR